VGSVSRYIRQHHLGLIAIFIALSGTAVAANVATEEAKRAVNKGVEAKPAAKKGKRGPRGPQGPAGPQGAVGPATGPAGGALAGNYPNPTLANGAVTPSTFGTIPAVRAFFPTDLSCATFPLIPSAADTVLLWFTEEFDTANLHPPPGCATLSSDHARLTAPIAGAYQVSAGIIWGASDTGTRFLGLRVNGTTMIAGDRRPFVPGLAEEQAISTLVRLNAGDYVETLVHQDSGGDLSFVQHPNSERRSHFAMHWVGPAP
jgi:hypothetical protein